MAYDNKQNESPLPAGGKRGRKTKDFLPKYFRTPKNEKFLDGTLDQITQPGVAVKLNGYYGRRDAKAFRVADNYVEDINSDRETYQLEPVVVNKDLLDNVNYYKDYNDYINQLRNFGSDVTNHSKLNQAEYYSWNPNVDWDKLVNFREYFWLPNGPASVQVVGQSTEIETTFLVNSVQNDISPAFVFNSNLEQNATIELFRGQTYNFQVSTPEMKFSIRTERNLDDEFIYEDNSLINNNIEEGTITFTVPNDAPNRLYYVDSNNINAGGIIRISDADEATAIDVEAEILGKKTYKTAKGFNLQNGMKINFAGDVTPAKFALGEYIVEGVGSSIKLINEQDLVINLAYADDVPIPFDGQSFDRLPYGNAASYSANKDYIVINRASPDRNAWSRNNKWFHRSVIEKAAELNGNIVDIDQSQRAKRPIIEFEAGIKLNNFGTQSKAYDIDIIDTQSKDVFSDIEGGVGYNIDGVDLTDGMRVLFVADTDIRVNNKIYLVKFITHNRTVPQIALIEDTNANPQNNDVVLIKKGTENGGKHWWYNGTKWIKGQEKTKLNQQPHFDLFDENGVSFSDTSVYSTTTFEGTKLFSYAVGTGTDDVELGFPLVYRALENVGDITFNFDLVTNSFTYQENNNVVSKKTKEGFLRKYSDISTFEYKNGWTKGKNDLRQKVVAQYNIVDTAQAFEIDVYDKSGLLTDLDISVLVDNKYRYDWSLSKQNEKAIVTFDTPIEGEAKVIIKTHSATSKNQNGHYEFPFGLERNSANKDLSTFTLGEINDHVFGMIEDLKDFKGEFPGNSNLGDLGDVNQFGKKFLQHAGPAVLPFYHITTQGGNIVKAIDFARKEYRTFKRSFIQIADTLGYEGPVRQHVDRILKEAFKTKTTNDPFYFSDMIPYQGYKRLEFTVYDEENNFFSLSEVFDLSKMSNKSVLIYKNGQQLAYDIDYTFNNDGFAVITAPKIEGDKIEIFEYESTDGSFVPPTPTKLGLYPKFLPRIEIDNSYRTPTTVIIGHDGSKTVGYNDFRDNLLLELERRIYNNCKVNYDTTKLDINDFVPSKDRDTKFTKKQIDNILLKDFVKWSESLGGVDYTTNNSFLETDSFTYNYSDMTGPGKIRIDGFWRNVYKEAYDTDTPHTTPWEMLGFSIKPKWWEKKYGPAPYTSDNLILWEDLQAGKIAEPGKPVIYNEKYVRQDLSKHIPVDVDGNLISPLASGYAKDYVQSYARKGFKFGDQSPAETAWRRSGEYPFSIVKAWLLSQPSKVMGLGWDISAVKRNLAGQWVYRNTNKPVAIENLEFSNLYGDVTRVYTSGFVDYVVNYVLKNSEITNNQYEAELKGLKLQLGIKLGAFTDKNKLRFILDSRTPFNKGNVFLPFENYTVALNRSSPTSIVSYSGVIIEKQSYGYVIRGYNKLDPLFYYTPAKQRVDDPNINVGGVSESFVEWDTDKKYTIDSYVRYENTFYKVVEEHTSTTVFDPSKYTKIPTIPTRGGVTAQFRTAFDTDVETLPYGHVFNTTQEVVDFLLGYGNYLETQGFTFDYYNQESQTVEDWKLSTKEFMYWTTQGWAPGTVLTLSPSANQITFKKEYNVVDDLQNKFYENKMQNAGGEQLKGEFTRLARSGNDFNITLVNTADGVYFVELPLVQIEHVALLDNTSVFGDVIYDPVTGYRQERIRVLGYVSDGWDGSLNIPGFVYDKAEVSDWEQYKDYAIGDTVLYKEFYYTAKNTVPGTEKFVANKWNKLDSKPTPKLLTNFDYRVNQFTDFYELESDNFDVEQQKLAQHLTGYQKRQYLENIINDDVSQFKFYQGFIQDKGTRNSIDKLFDSLASANKESVDFNEEWAIKTGSYGATDNYDEIEWQLDENQFKVEPQTIELVDNVPVGKTDLVYRIPNYDVFLKPTGYDTNKLPTKYNDDFFVKTVGYVTGQDVNRAVTTKDGILDFNITDIDKHAYIWVATNNQTWDVLQHTESSLRIVGFNNNNSVITITLNETVRDISVGDIFGITNMNTTTYTNMDGFYKATKVYNNIIEFTTTKDDYSNYDDANPQGTISFFTSQREADLQSANDNVTSSLKQNEIIWVDNDDNNKWTVLKNNKVYNEHQKILSSIELDSSFHGFGHSISVNQSNTVMAVGIPYKGNGQVHIYKRASDSTNFVLDQILDAPISVIGNTSVAPQFGESVAVSPDGLYVVVGSPKASSVYSFYQGEFNPSRAYNKRQVVKYGPNLFEAIQAIDPSTSAIEFSSFDSFVNIVSQSDSSLVNLLQAGDYKLNNQQTSHVLVRAPYTAYNASAVGDTLVLNWNNFSYVHPEGYNVDVQPFNGEFPAITDGVISDQHTIQKKVDNVLVVQNYVNLPSVGETISSAVASGEIVHVANNIETLTIYVSNVNGTFEQSGTLFVGNLRIGDFSEDFQDNTNVLGGYWWIDTPTYTTSNDSSNVFTDPGHGLVYVDILTAASGRTTPNFYYNITPTEVTAQNNQTQLLLPVTLNEQASFMETLTYEGDPNNNFAVYPSPLWTVRGPATFTSTLSNGDKFYMDVDVINTDFTDTAIDRTLINKEHTVSDLWDGYIDFEFTQFQNVGGQQLPFELVIGDTVRDSVTGAEAEVAFYKRQFNDVRIYVKNVTGTWSVGDNFGTTANILRIRANARPIGEIKQVSIAGSLVGKIIVIEEDSNFANVAQSQLTNFEYFFYDVDTLQGIPRDPNIPSSNNNDWNLVNNLIVKDGPGTTVSGLTEEGMFTVYDISNTGQYQVYNSYTVPERQNYKRLGDEISFSKDGGIYRISVASNGNNTSNNAGSIHFIKHGTDTDANTFDFNLDINPLFRGEFDSQTFYKQNEIVEYLGKPYQALRNIASGSAFIQADWTALDIGISHVGYIPNTPLNAFVGEETFDPEFGIRDFAKSFDQTPDGSVMIVSSRIQGNDSTGERVVNVYRQLPGGQYILSQSIEAPYVDLSTGNLSGFGDAVSISTDGEMIAISETFNDNIKRDQGVVYVYTLQNQQFVLNQTLKSPNNEQTEHFGAYINFDGNQLAVTSLNGDIEIPNTFDNDTTTFDDGFTKFKKASNIDAGVIFMYERINKSLIYSEQFIFDDPNAIQFGKNLLVKQNHVYTAIPEMTDLATYQGIIVDFRKPIGSKAWNTHRSPIDQIDIPNIKNLFLYNTETNTLVQSLDFIDPVQGKIAGPAEQEISYKTYYDPATYSIGDDTVVVDEQNSWGADHVGQLWWDIGAVKYYNYYQNDIQYQTNYWGKPFPNGIVNVYEWVMTDLLPAEWNEIADTNDGLDRGISGISRYGDEVYSTRLVWDSVAGRSKPKYFYWVANKKVLPSVENRKLTAFAVRQLINDPAGQGYAFAALQSKDRMALFNVKPLLSGNNVALNLSYYTLDNQEQNRHLEYQILTDGIGSSRPNRDIELKWFDSLIGYDRKDRQVPDPRLSAKAKYGINNKPRQSMFVNRTEALKEVIERANGVLIKNIIVDEFDISRLRESDPQPNITSRRYDLAIDTFQDLPFVGVAKRITAELTPTIIDGRIVSVAITNPGRGYIDPSYTETSTSRLGPTVTVNGIGTDAIIETTIDEVGKITSVNIVDPGEGYDSATTLTVRNFTVLVVNDDTVSNKWSLYNYNGSKWNRTVAQRFDTNLFWEYKDWYEDGFNAFTEIKDLIDYSYQLDGLQNNVGDIVKISSVGTGGWLLLEKIDDQQNVDYTVNYAVVGKQNATIQFKSGLYDVENNLTGFDSNTFDTNFYDNQPVTETRIILEVLRDNLFVDNLNDEYNKLFVASLRYAFKEQPNIDWAFKTSFIQAVHNVGDLSQRITFKNDSIESYQDYINEVKPYKTKVRQYVSSYEKVEPTNTTISDFDLPPRYDYIKQKIIPTNTKINNNVITNLPDSIDQYPDKWWKDNVGYEIKEITIGKTGNLYVLPPKVTIEGGGGSGATAKAYLSNSKLSKIEILTPGSGYTSIPDVVLNGSVSDGGEFGSASAVLGNGKVRAMHVITKFDRVSGTPYILEVKKSETFTGTAVTSVFNLKWPMNLNGAKVKVYLNGVESLRSEYTFENYIDKTKTYTREKGRIIFTDAPKLGTVVKVDYELSPNLLTAQDRIEMYYAPTSGMLGKDITQLMEGVDFGGVEVKSFDFKGSGGFEVDGYGTVPYDIYDNTYEDIIVQLDGSTVEFSWDNPLENGVVYNVYKNNVRIDDPNYLHDSSRGANPNAIMRSITGDGQQTTLNLDDLVIPSTNGDVFILRKVTSDGSFKPDSASYDTQLSGGALSYNNAKGIDAAEIIVDGDNFITPMTTTGPEELVPGRIADTVDIQVYHRPDDGASEIISKFWTTDGVNGTFDLGQHPNSIDAVWVKLDNATIKKVDYTIDWVNDTLTFDTIPTAGKVLNIVTMGNSGEKILDIDKFVADGSTNTFVTNAIWTDNATHFANINGVEISSQLYKTDDGLIGIEFNVAPQIGQVVDYGIFYGSNKSYSSTTTHTFVGDGSTTVFDIQTDSIGGLPTQHNTIVSVNDVILQAGYNIEMLIEANEREYFIEDWQYYSNSVKTSEVEVYLNDELLRKAIDYRWNSTANSITLTQGIGVVGDKLEIFLMADGEYAFGYVGTDETSTQRFISTRDKVYFDTAPVLGSTVEVQMFSNHDIQNLTRTKYDFLTRKTLVGGTQAFADYVSLANGIIKLRKEASHAQDVWVFLNGDRLVANVDYRTTDDPYYIKILKNISANDTIEYIEWSQEKLTVKFGFREFKDILNRVHYKRIDDNTKYKLASDLNWFDTKIDLVDATGLNAPSKASKIPGVVFINGERIEYFVKQGNSLRQIRRGTLGTGVNTLLTTGTEVIEQGPSENIPYRDETITQIFTADGVASTYELDFDASAIATQYKQDSGSTKTVAEITADLFEVFVAGRRLRKSAISVYQTDTKDAQGNFVTRFVDQDSPEGDITANAEFTLNGNTIQLAETPTDGQKIVVIRRIGKTWTNLGESLADADNDIANFIRARTTELPN